MLTRWTWTWWPPTTRPMGHTVTMDSLRAAQTQLADKPAEFARAYGNRATGAGERVIPREDWAKAVHH
jgi:hypothetical protein